MSIHRTTDVEQQQQLDGVASFRAHLDVQKAGVAGGVVDGAVDVQLFGRTLARELAQAAQGDLDIARAQLNLVVEVFVLALVPDLHRLPLALAGVADANAFGVVAAGAERAGAAGADPFVAAGMAFFLFFQALFEFLDQLVEATKGLDLRAFFIAQRTLEFLAQPVFGDQRLQMVVELFQAVEIGTKRAVELVEMPLVLDQDRPGQVVELVHVGEGHALLERVDQVEQLAHGHRHLGGAHLVEQVEQH